MATSYRLGDYLLSMEGLAILRVWGTDPAFVRERADEISAISGELNGDLYGAAAIVPKYEAADGYRRWAASYDSMPNFLIDVEERTVHPMLDELPVGRALDAACGTGRHASWLAARGHDVIGIDAVEEMLAVARDKVPAGRFQIGQMDALDIPDASFDLVVCALALTHLPTINGAIAEFARVLAPGGRLILSDIHPFGAILGFHAFFRTATGDRGCIQNRYHPISRYLRAFQAANLAVVRCIEVPWEEQQIAGLPTYHLIPRALDTALQGLPLLLVWELAALGERR